MRVVVIKNEDFGPHVGDTGTVICEDTVDPRRVGVVYDKRVLYGHTLNGRCNVGCGWFTLKSHTKPISDKIIDEEL